MEYRSQEKQSPEAKSGRLSWWFMNHLFNPIVRLILRSPLHRLFSGSILLITYHGRKSGKAYSIPVQYAQADKLVYILPGAPEQKMWWRNLRGGAPVQLRLCGQDLSARAEVLTGDAHGDEIRAALDSYLRRFSAAARIYQVRRTPAGNFDAADLQTAARQMIVVRVALDPLADGE
jgi:deazaflavin-dependent oxidoreductase (nitroreductase family)